MKRRGFSYTSIGRSLHSVRGVGRHARPKRVVGDIAETVSGLEAPQLTWSECRIPIVGISAYGGATGRGGSTPFAGLRAAKTPPSSSSRGREADMFDELAPCEADLRSRR